MATEPKNPFGWVEIYVEDLNRARKFYETTLAIELSELTVGEGTDDLKMLSFPWAENERNISGALVKTKEMAPGKGGTLVYFTCEDCSIEESRVEKAGGKILRPKMGIGEYGFVSIIMDTEGNPVGLHSMK